MTRFVLATLVGLALVAGARAEVKLSNMVLRWGPHAPPRPDAVYGPKQKMQFSVDLSDLEFDENGAGDIRLTIELLDANGTTIFLDKENLHLPTSFREETARLNAGIQVPNATSPGEYSLKLSVKDPFTTKELTSVQRKVRVTADEFQVVLAGFRADVHEKPGNAPFIPAVLQMGQTVCFEVHAVGMSHENDKVLVDTDFWVTKAGVGQPIRAPRRFTADQSYLGQGMWLAFNMQSTSPPPGKYICHARVTDRRTKKVNEVAVPLVVLDSMPLLGVEKADSVADRMP